MASNGPIDLIVAFIGNFDPSVHFRMKHFAAGSNSVAGKASYAAANSSPHRSLSLPCGDLFAAVRGAPAGEEFRPAGCYMRK